MMKSGAQPSQKKITTTQVEETHKKMKYTKKGPVITLTEDDVEFMVDKVQDRGEDVVHITEAQREEIMAKLIEFHDTLQQLQIHTVQQATTQQPEKTQQPPAQKEKEDTVQIVVQGSDTFMVTQQMVRVDQETTQKTHGGHRPL
jgi:tRNA A37 N6-isopentenylltransferase MiaA